MPCSLKANLLTFSHNVRKRKGKELTINQWQFCSIPLSKKKVFLFKCTLTWMSQLLGFGKMVRKVYRSPTFCLKTCSFWYRTRFNWIQRNIPTHFSRLNLPPPTPIRRKIGWVGLQKFNCRVSMFIVPSNYDCKITNRIQESRIFDFITLNYSTIPSCTHVVWCGIE